MCDDDVTVIEAEQLSRSLLDGQQGNKYHFWLMNFYDIQLMLLWPGSKI